MLSLHESAYHCSDPAALARVEQLRDDSSRPEVLEVLRAEILKGTIRVTPGGGRGAWKILPTARMAAASPSRS